MLGNTVPKNKYGAKVSRCAHGHTHPSRKEARRCGELHLLQRAGVISELKTQVQFWFVIDGIQLKSDNGRRMGVKLDFSYLDGCGRLHCEDTKGYKVRDWPLRKAVFMALFPEITLKEL